MLISFLHLYCLNFTRALKWSFIIDSSLFLLMTIYCFFLFFILLVWVQNAQKQRSLSFWSLKSSAFEFYSCLMSCYSPLCLLYLRYLFALNLSATACNILTPDFILKTLTRHLLMICFWMNLVWLCRRRASFTFTIFLALVTSFHFYSTLLRNIEFNWYLIFIVLPQCLFSSIWWVNHALKNRLS